VAAARRRPRDAPAAAAPTIERNGPRARDDPTAPMLRWRGVPATGWAGCDP